MSTIDKKWLTVEEAAEHTQTDVGWIMEHVKNGSLKSVVTANRKASTGPGKYRRRIDRAKLDALMEALEVSEVSVVAGVESSKGKSPKPESGRPTQRPGATGSESLRDRWRRENG